MGIDGGTLVPFNVENTRVMNGTIDGMGNIGIFANVNARVEKMNVSSNASYGTTRLVEFSILAKAIRASRRRGSSGIRDRSSIVDTGCKPYLRSSVAGHRHEYNYGPLCRPTPVMLTI
jgi:hypothetical protein